MLIEHIQLFPALLLARFCANIATDGQVSPVIAEQAARLAEEWATIMSQYASEPSVAALETTQESLRIRMIDFLIGLSDAATKRNDVGGFMVELANDGNRAVACVLEKRR